MNEIKIITELCEEDRKRIAELSYGLGCLAGLLTQLVKAGPYTEDKDAVQAKEMDLPKDDPLADIPAEVKLAEEHPVENPFTEAPKQEEPAEDTPKVTKDDVRKLFVKLAAAGKKDQAREIVTAFASSITDLPDDVVSTVYLKLIGLEG